MIEKYVRLLSYHDAVQFIKAVKDIGGDAHVVSCGIKIYYEEHQFSRIKQFLDSLDTKYEITERHPSEIVKEIIESLKKENS